MPYNAIAQTFAPTNWFAPFPVATESYAGLTTAQLAANSSFTAISCAANVSTLVSAASKRTTGVTIIVPTDQLSCAFDNSPVVATSTTTGQTFFPQAQSYIGTPNLTLINASLGNAFIIPPGSQLVLAPFNDALYGFPTNAATTIYFQNN